MALGQIWAHSQVVGETCAKALGNTTGTLVGTAFTARDFIRVAEALGGDGLLRYWGKLVTGTGWRPLALY